MKKIPYSLVIVLTMILHTTLYAQNRSIDFKHITLEEAFQMSGATGKTVFVDCYTQWCGPCKAMSANVFTIDSVADYFNANFINIKLDMETEEGKKYANPYKVEAYPSFLLLNSKGELLFKFIGGMPADKFMAKIKEGLNPDNKVATMDRMYKQGNCDGKFYRDYIMLKLGLNERTEGKRIASEYFDKLTHQERISPDNWLLFGRNRFERELSGVGSKNVVYLLDHYEDFIKTVGADSVYSKIASNVRQTADYVLRGWYFKDHERNPQDFIDLKNKVAKTGIPDKSQYLAIMDMVIAVAENDSLKAGNILADNIGNFSADNQQVMFGFLAYIPQHSPKAHPRLLDMVKAVLRSGKQSNLMNYLKSAFPPLEELESEKYDVPNLKNKVGTTQVVPFFHPKKDICWYVFEKPGGERHYYSFDSKNKKREIYNTHVVDSLLKLNNSGYDPKFVFYSPKFNDTGIVAYLEYLGKNYEYKAEGKQLIPLTKEKPKIRAFGLSPDGRYELIMDKKSLKVKNVATGQFTELSSDSEEEHGFVLADMGWVGKTNKFYITRTDKRRLKTMPLLHSTSSGRPFVTTYTYELPGDSIVTGYEVYAGDAEKGTFNKINIDKWPGQEVNIVKAGGVNDRFFLLRKKRTRDELELCSVNVSDGSVRVLISEKSRPYINYDLFQCHIIKNGSEILFWSDRDGWGHFYRYDSEGRLINQITKGEWTAANIAKIDTAANQLFVYGYGKEANRNPNYSYLYKVKTDGKKIKLLTTENATHHTFISPSCNLIIDNYSRIDTLPVISARDGEGRLIERFEHPDISKLLDYGWKMPEQFTIKAADGVTDLYGIMWKPFDFDSTRVYPVVSQVYPGPHTETVWTEFTVFDRYNNTALAQRGIIVVCMGHRGGTPVRNKAYASYGYGNIRDFALLDDKAGLEQLCRRYRYMDSTRIGIYGHSGGAMMSVAAICTFPDFYKVAVASSGNYDNNIYNRNWVESYHGVDENYKLKVGTNMDLVSGLRGKLFLITGDNDANVHPAHTFRLIDALIKNNKDFDLLILPGQTHSYENTYKSYFERRKRDYFTKYLVR
ncbi:MAG: prolyl oligopeptidase family serine peptidase [Rikenellaceae bacterium]|nr:prolyl oligopeptidase family serine peptidase [Rikenellaceae bacterium]